MISANNVPSSFGRVL